MFSASIDWADGNSSAPGVIVPDGTGGFRVTGTHSYGTTGMYAVRVTIQDGTGPSAATTGTVRCSGTA